MDETNINMEIPKEKPKAKINSWILVSAALLFLVFFLCGYTYTLTNYYNNCAEKYNECVEECTQPTLVLGSKSNPSTVIDMGELLENVTSQSKES